MSPRNNNSNNKGSREVKRTDLNTKPSRPSADGVEVRLQTPSNTPDVFTAYKFKKQTNRPFRLITVKQKRSKTPKVSKDSWKKGIVNPEIIKPIRS